VIILSSLISKFFRNYLQNEKGYSQNTLESYSQCIQMLLSFCRTEKKINIDTIDLADFSQELILEFLTYLETIRGNSANTRNQRLAIIKSFFRYAASQQPCFLEVSQKVCAIGTKRIEQKIIKSLSLEEVIAIINMPDTSAKAGARDHFLLSLLYHTGARVQELCDIKIGDVVTEGLPQLQLTGKGKKVRIIPLQEETVSAMKHYMEFRVGAKDDEYLLLNARNAPITRSGVTYLIKKYTKQAAIECTSLEGCRITPHVFRHTNALHLIQSGVDVLIVKEWLGHKSLKTTMQYININIDMKRKALELFPAPISSSANQKPVWQEPDIIILLKKYSSVM
jgi:integrase/recombinase XerD